MSFGYDATASLAPLNYTQSFLNPSAATSANLAYVGGANQAALSPTTLYGAGGYGAQTNYYSQLGANQLSALTPYTFAQPTALQQYQQMQAQAPAYNDYSSTGYTAPNLSQYQALPDYSSMYQMPTPGIDASDYNSFYSNRVSPTDYQSMLYQPPAPTMYQPPTPQPMPDYTSMWQSMTPTRPDLSSYYNQGYAGVPDYASMYQTPDAFDTGAIYANRFSPYDYSSMMYQPPTPTYQPPAMPDYSSMYPYSMPQSDFSSLYQNRTAPDYSSWYQPPAMPDYSSMYKGLPDYASMYQTPDAFDTGANYAFASRFPTTTMPQVPNYWDTTFGEFGSGASYAPPDTRYDPYAGIMSAIGPQSFTGQPPSYLTPRMPPSPWGDTMNAMPSYDPMSAFGLDPYAQFGGLIGPQDPTLSGMIKGFGGTDQMSQLMPYWEGFGGGGQSSYAQNVPAGYNDFVNRFGSMPDATFSGDNTELIRQLQEALLMSSPSSATAPYNSLPGMDWGRFQPSPAPGIDYSTLTQPSYFSPGIGYQDFGTAYQSLYDEALKRAPYGPETLTPLDQSYQYTSPGGG